MILAGRRFRSVGLSGQGRATSATLDGSKSSSVHPAFTAHVLYTKTIGDLSRSILDPLHLYEDGERSRVKLPSRYRFGGY